MLSKKTNTVINLLLVNSFFPFLLIVISFYPFSPVFFKFNNVYLILWTVIFWLIAYCSTKKHHKKQNQFLNSYVILLSLVQIICFLVNQNLSIIRELVSVILLYAIFLKFEKNQVLTILRNYSKILGYILAVCIPIFFYAILNNNFRIEWENISNSLFIGENNPFFVRQDYKDFEWSLVFNFVVIPYNSLKDFQRASLIFLEPSSLAFYSIFPMLVSFHYQNLKPFKWILFVYISSFALAQSVWGFLSILFALFFLFVFYINKKHLILFLLFLLIVILCVTMIYDISLSNLLLQILPADKREQICSSIENKTFFSFNLKEITFFGLSNQKKYTQSSFGFETVLYRYGVFGICFYFISFFFFILNGFGILKSKKFNYKMRILSFLTILSTCFFSLKSNSIILIQPFLSYYFSKSILNTKT